jgi:tRNA(fMet)-specific endonuclease VapC
LSADGQLWLLDTNIISGLMREPTGLIAVRLAQNLQQIEGAQIGTSVIVDCELRFGLAKNSSDKLLEAYRVTMAAIKLFNFESAAVQRYANLRHYLEGQGTPIGPNDMLIAAHALALNCTLVTANEDEFRRVPGLRVENWTKTRQV